MLDFNLRTAEMDLACS